ncbi:hypothetical protein [Bartonella queenslandensis]|uniref:hypothetical protein n=1 Tax=Bartonella queenslandensis TaxID=481138 RepID=UPI001FCCA720|nr:hypothetical protein [Bartonella queenslandensis]
MTERVVIACLARMFVKKYPPNDSKKVGGVMMQEWIVENAIFLLHWINDNAVFLLRWIRNNPTIAPIIATIVTGMVALFVQQRSLKKQLKIFKRQTIASETQTAILLEDKKARDLGPYLRLKAIFIPQKYEASSTVKVGLYIKNLTRKDIMIRNIRISKRSPFKFIKNACSVLSYKSDIRSEQPFITKRTAPKLIATGPKNIKSNSSLEYALNFFIIPAGGITCLDFMITCRKPSSRNIANFTLEHTSIINPEETRTVHFWASWPRSKATYHVVDPKYFLVADDPYFMDF